MEGAKMTKHIRKEVKTKEIEVSIMTGITCDWCGKDAWAIVGRYDVREFEFYFKEGSNYGSNGGNVQGWQIDDLCNECVEKLQALLIDNGLHLTKIEEGW